MRNDRENQKRLMEEFHRISDNYTISNSQPALSHHPLDQDIFFENNSFLVSSHHSSLSYESIHASQEEPQLQVDHNGAKALHLPSTANWLPVAPISHIPSSSSSSTSSSYLQTFHPSLPHAAVAAAAITAAMIVVPHSVVPKRPRCPDSLYQTSPYHTGIQDTSYNYTNTDHHNEGSDDDDDDDIITEASLQQSEDPSSPRSVSAFVKETLQHQPSSIIHKTKSRSTRQLITNLILSAPPEPLLHLTSLIPNEDVRTSTSSSPQSPPDALSSKQRRAQAMERFRRKKAVRCYGRQVRYQIRKRIATTRPRVNGRFARRTDTRSEVPSSTVNVD